MESLVSSENWLVQALPLPLELLGQDLIISNLRLQDFLEEATS